MKLKEGDEFVAEDLGEDTIVLKKINLRSLLEDAIEKAKSIDLDKLESEIEEESNQLARQKFKVSSR
jgi:AbrB family transcriptional regulator (stage V sporulation protein T)